MRPDDGTQPKRPALPFWMLALLDAGLFAAVGASLALHTSAPWGSYAGILFHLGLLPVVARLPAAQPARAMGYAWVAVDIVASILLLDGIDDQLAMGVRLGGHVLAAVWIVEASYRLGYLPVRLFGFPAGAMLAANSILGSRAGHPPPLLIASGPLTVLWLLSISVYYRGRRDSH